MSFMEPEIYEGSYYYVETNEGSFIVTGEEFGNAPEIVCDDHKDYIEGKPLNEQVTIKLQHGWLCRLRAPGYMDTTSWSAFSTEKEAIKHLLEMYGGKNPNGEDWEHELGERLGELTNWTE